MPYLHIYQLLAEVGIHKNRTDDLQTLAFVGVTFGLNKTGFFINFLVNDVKKADVISTNLFAFGRYSLNSW